MGQPPVETAVRRVLRVLRDHEVLEEGSRQGTAFEELAGLHAREMAGKARVPEVQLRPLHEALAEVAVEARERPNSSPV